MNAPDNTQSGKLYSVGWGGARSRGRWGRITFVRFCAVARLVALAALLVWRRARARPRNSRLPEIRVTPPTPVSACAARPLRGGSGTRAAGAKPETAPARGEPRAGHRTATRSRPALQT